MLKNQVYELETGDHDQPQAGPGVNQPFAPAGQDKGTQDNVIDDGDLDHKIDHADGAGDWVGLEHA